MNVEFQILSEVDTILFSLLILHGLTDSQGCVWRRHLSQLYTIEVTLLKKVCDKNIYRTLAKEGPWSVHLTLGQNWGVGRYSRYQYRVYTRKSAR